MSDSSLSLPQKAPRPRKGRVMGVLMVLMLLAGCGWGGWWYVSQRMHEGTDDAYVSGNVLRVMPQISGKVLSVLADDTDRVFEGQPLVRLDTIDAKLAFERALVDLATAVRSTSQLMAKKRESESVINMRRVDLRQATDNLKRREVLGKRNAIGQEELHNARNAMETAAGGLAVAQEQHNALAAQLLDTALPDQPAVQQAAAVVRDRWLALQRTTIVSPLSGQIARRSVQAGEVVAPGTPLMTVVALDRLWIDANFKEVQLRRMRVGQPAEVTVDLYGSKVRYTGRVAGFSAGTGSVFALIPPQNATGNWIKIVQRVPVRIELDAQTLAAHPLLVGLSSVVRVNVADDSGELLLRAPRKHPTPPDMHNQAPALDFAEVDALIARTIRENSQTSQSTAN